MSTSDFASSLQTKIRTALKRLFFFVVLPYQFFKKQFQACKQKYWAWWDRFSQKKSVKAVTQAFSQFFGPLIKRITEPKLPEKELQSKKELTLAHTNQCCEKLADILGGKANVKKVIVYNKTIVVHIYMDYLIEPDKFNEFGFLVSEFENKSIKLVVGHEARKIGGIFKKWLKTLEIKKKDKPIKEPSKYTLANFALWLAKRKELAILKKKAEAERKEEKRKWKQANKESKALQKEKAKQEKLEAQERKKLLLAKKKEDKKLHKIKKAREKIENAKRKKLYKKEKILSKKRQKLIAAKAHQAMLAERELRKKKIKAQSLARKAELKRRKAQKKRRRW